MSSISTVPTNIKLDNICPIIIADHFLSIILPVLS